MNNETPSQIIDKIRSISKEVVQTEFPKELEFFETIWGVMREYISQWERKYPQELQIEECQESLKKELGFLDEAEVSEINTPKVIALISLVWLKLTKYEGQIQDVNIEETITKYGKSLPEWLRLKTMGLAVPLIKNDLKKIGRISATEAEAEEEKKYMMYSHENKDGEPISGIELTQKEFKRKGYIIWMNATKRISYVKRCQVEFDPIHWRLLIYLIKKKGEVAEYQELYERFCKWVTTKNKYFGWDESLRSTVHRWVADIRGKAKKQNKLTMEEKIAFHNFIKNEPKEGYRIKAESEEYKYCLIETRHIE